MKRQDMNKTEAKKGLTDWSYSSHLCYEKFYKVSDGYHSSQ